MSDIFNNLYESNEKQTSVMERNADRALSVPKAETIPQPGKYFTDIINKSNENEAQKQEDIKNYSVNLPQEQYDIINTAISNAEVPEDEAFRWACALEYRKQFDLPLSYTYEHLEDINKGIWGERSFNPKTNFRAIVDYGHIGTNTLRQGFLGNAIMAQELSGDTDSEEYRNNIKEYQDLENSNLSLQDAQPRNWAITALKYGAQSLPFTGYVAGSGIVGSLLAPGAGTALAFSASMQQTLGQEYMDMRANGASPETAAKVGVISGALQAGVEVALGDVAHFMGKTAATMGKDVIGSATRRAISEKITASCFKRLVHSGGVKQIAGIIGKEALSAAGEWTEEGAEEVVQEIISIMGKNIAASMDEYEIEHRSAGDIAKDLFEQFKGGALGSIVLSGFPMAMGIKADFNDFRDVKNSATTIQSKEAFKKSVKDSRIFDGMDEGKKAKTEDDIWNSYAKERQDNADKQAKEYSEVYSAGEGMEEVVETEDAEGNQIVDENGIPVEKQQAYRTEDKKLYTQNDIQNEEDNKVKGRYKVGNGTESEKNLYGYIDYTLDSEKNTVTINKFAMSSQREDIRQEFYDGFAEKFAGNEIEWNPQWDAGKGIKQNLIDNNPGGKNNGLSYFAEEKDVTDFAVRKNVAQQIKKAMPNFSAGERGAAVALLEAGAKAQGKSISDYVAMTFSKNIFGDAKEAESLAQAQGKVIQGAQSWKQFAEGTRAVIYATEKADFSTWTHEIAHVWRKQLTGDLKAQAEKAFNVENGNWTTAQEEQFAVGFEDYLRTGKAPSNTLHTLYKELAQFLSRVYGALKSRVNITPEISKVYDQLLKGGDSVLRQAEAAVKQADEEYAKSNEKAVKSEQNVQKTAEKGAKTEQIGEPASDKIKSFFSGDNISKETAEETTETIKSPDSSLKEKNDASLNAASEAMMNDVALFQGEDAQIAAVREQYENTDKWMKAPNRKDTKLSEEQWLQVRTPNFKRWFGNWNYDENKQIEVTELDTKNLPFDWTDTGSLKNWLKESIVGKTVYNANNGSKIEFTPGKTKASIKRRGAEQRGAYSVIDKLVENAELFDFEENDGQEKHAALLGQDVYYSAMKAGDKYYSVKIKVDIGKTDLRVMYKDHKVSEIEIAPYPYHESAKAYHADIDAIHTFSIGQLAGNIKPQNISKVVDENGEPLVVYHGTEQAEFDIFKTDGSKTTNFATPSGTAWFTGDKDTAASYSGEYNEPTYKTIGKEYVPGIYSVFLNIKKPFIYDNKTDIYRPNDIVSNALKSEQYDGVILNGAIYDFGIYAEDLNTPVKIRNDYIAFNPNQIKSATDNSGAFNSNNPSILFQTAYHGSPYNFDNFSTENIGSGEGNQSFGWGLYFSNKKEVAEYYADKLSDEAKRNLYTVDITDGKFLQWDKAVPAKEENRIKKALFNILIQGDYKGAERELSEELNGVFTDSTGEYLYNDITAYLGSPKDASLFLKENGYTGLEYPGGTLSQAESKDTRNYIVFADKDVSITDHILFQTIGQNGAQNLDNAEEATTRLDNLSIAKEMESKNKDAKSIRLATGWEKGTDGKWRYEIDDNKLAVIRNPKLKEIVIDEDSNEVVYTGVLQDILKSDELFTAYPELKNITIQTGTGSKYSGSYSPKEKHIFINTNFTDTKLDVKKRIAEIEKSLEMEEYNSAVDDEKATYESIIEAENKFYATELGREYKELVWGKENTEKALPDNIKSVLIHEVQHAIQEIEGFAKGGIEEQFKTDVSSPFTDITKSSIESKTREADKVFNSLPGEWQNKVREINQATIANDLKKSEFLFDEIDENAPPEVSKKIDSYFALMADAQKAKDEGVRVMPYEAYTRLAGEVEARNAQKRINMSAEERRQKLLADTADVAPEDQIMLFQEKYPNLVDITNEFKENPTKEQIKEHLNSLIGKVFNTQTAGKFIDILNNSKKKKHIIDSSRYSTLRTAERKRHNTYVFSSEKLIENAEYVRSADNIKVEKKPNISKYHYFEVPVQIGNHVWNVQLVCEEIKKGADAANRDYFTQLNGKHQPQQLQDTSALENLQVEDVKPLHLYDILEGKMLFQSVNNDASPILFQTQSQLMETAKDFNTWQEFMEFEQTMFSGDVAIPEFADAEWYQTVWEAAHGEQNTAQKNEEDMKTTARADEMNGSRPDVQDAMFMSEIQKKGKLEEFLRRIHEIEATEINESPEDDIEVAENEKLAELKRFIHTQLTHGVWLSNSMRAFKGRDILPATRQRMLTLMGSAARDYRAIYSEIMDNQDFKVDEKDSVAYKMKNNPLVDPNDDLTERSPEYRRQLAEKIQNMEMKRKIADGSLKLDDELDNYIKDLDSKVKESDKKLQALKDDIDSDYKSISDWQTRELLKLHEQMLVARAKYTRNDTTSRHIEKGIKISEKYMLKSQNLKADYDSIFRKYEDLKNSIVISEEAKNALKRQEDYEEIKQDNKERRTEKSAADKVKKMRIQLVKRTMRRVPFERVDYKNAYAIIAIQRIFEPNLEGGVNQWIGTEGSYLRGVWSSFITDAAKRENIIKYLSRKGKIAHRILDLLNNTKTADDFNSWSLKDRRDAHRVLPREDWIWSLHLANLSEERKGSIQQNIEETQQTRMVPSKKNPGEMVPQYYTTVTFGDDIRDIVREALGSDMFETLVHRPFAEWTTEEMETLAKRVDELYVEGRDSLQAKKELEKERARELRDKIESAVRNTGIQINEGDPEDVKKKKQEKINKILGHTTSVKGTLDAKKRNTVINRILHGYGDANIRRVARILDNYTEGTNTNILYWKENDCFNRKSRAMQQRENTINTAMKNTGVTLEDLYNKVTIDNFYKGESRTFTVDELLYYLAADKDGNSRDACAYGCMIDEKYRDTYRIMDEKTKDADRMKTTDASGNELIASEGTLAYMSDCNILFDKILGEAKKLDKKYLDFSDAIADDYTIQFDRMNKLSIEEFGIPVWRVEKYVPLIRLESSGDTNQNRVREDLLGTSGVGAKTWVDKGMTQKRVAISPLNQKPVQSGLYTTWVDSVERTEHFIAYAPYVRELRRIYTSRDAAPTRQWIESRYTKGMLNYLDDYINEVANPNANSAQSSLDQVCRALRGKTATAYLAWKASSVVKQALTSPAPFMQFVNPKEYLAAAFKMISDKGTADAIRGKSAYMASRTMDPMVDLVKAQAEKSTNKIAHAVNSFNVMGMGGLEWIDWACVAPGWLAVYDKEYARLTSESKSSYETKKAELESNGKLNEEQIANELEKTVKSAAQIEVEAVSKADDATRLCQPSSRLTDLSPIFKSRGKNSEVAKAVLQFQTSLNVIWQNIRYDIPYAVRQKQYRQIAGTVLGYMVAGIAVTLICDSSGGDDDKGSDKMRKFLFSATTQFSDSVPVIGSAITRTTEKFITGKSAYSFGNSLFPLLDKIQQGTMSAASGDWEKAASKFAEGVALSTGLPVSGAKELLYTAGLGDGKKGAEFKPLSLAGRRD